MSAGLDELEVFKAHGGGNDFVILLGNTRAIQDPTNLAIRLCDRNKGIGADGLILVEWKGKNCLALRGFNCDGSSFQLCTNGFRCAVKAAHYRGVIAERVALETPIGLLKAIVVGKNVRLELPAPCLTDCPCGIAGLTLVSTGDLHAISVEPESLSPLPVGRSDAFSAWAREIRRQFQSLGYAVNVHRISPAPGCFRIQSFEKGVESETLSCGSGMLSAAVVLQSLGGAGRGMRFGVSGDAIYRVAVVGNRASISGPVHLIFFGNLVGG